MTLFRMSNSFQDNPKFYCPVHHIRFPAAAEAVVLCGQGPHRLGAGFPRDSWWEYCCDCGTFWPSDSAKNHLQRDGCLVCERLIARRYLCGECQVVSIESITLVRRKTYFINDGAGVEPNCPGCATTASGAILDHNCPEAAIRFSTSRSICPFCDGQITKSDAAHKSTADPKAFCGFCGTERTPDNKFCKECGKAQPSDGRSLKSSKSAARKRAPGETTAALNAEKRARQILLDQAKKQLDEEALRVAEAERSRHEAEVRRRDEEDARRIAEKERLRREAEAKRRKEEERLRLEAEARRRAEAEQLRIENERRQAAEEQRRIQEAQKRAEAEARSRSQETRRQAEAQRRIDEKTRARARIEEVGGAALIEPHLPPAFAGKVETEQALVPKANKVESIEPEPAPDESHATPRSAKEGARTATVSALHGSAENDEEGQSHQPDEIEKSPSSATPAYVPSWHYTPSPTPTPKRRLPWLVAGSVVIVLVAIVVGLTILQGNRQRQSPLQPERRPTRAVPPGMVAIPGGEFLMGNDGGDEYEKPAHKVTVNPFYMDAKEVTCADYQRFIKESGQTPPSKWENGNYPSGSALKPVTGVDWDDATTYAQWAKKRLPTEEEWEFAARGTDGRRYPWGNDWIANVANAGDSSARQFVDVGSYPAGKSPFGVMDMVGNAWEWTASELKAYPGGQLPADASGPLKVIRGGFWGSTIPKATTTFRRGWDARNAKTGYDNTGFRCASDVSVK